MEINNQQKSKVTTVNTHRGTDRKFIYLNLLNLLLLDLSDTDHCLFNVPRERNVITIFFYNFN